MSKYQVQKDSQGYKNPRVENPNSAMKRPTAPVQRGGLMDTAARARALKPGIPPIPSLQPPEIIDAKRVEDQKQTATQPAMTPININVGAPQVNEPRVEAAKALAKEEEVTYGAPEGGWESMGYLSDMQAVGGGGAGKPADAEEPATEEEAVETAAISGEETQAAIEKANENGEGWQLGMLIQAQNAGEDLNPEQKALLDKYGVYTGPPPGAGDFATDGEDAPLEGVGAATDAVTSAKEMVEPWLYEYMSSDLGISETDISNQIEQLKMASSEEIAKFAQQMASRGMGASGLVGAGMGQIQSSTMAAMANVRFEAAKLAVDDRLNRLKSYLATYGNMISTEAQLAMQSEINKLANDQFDYQQQQDRVADQWQSVANWAAAHGAKGYVGGTLDKVWDKMHSINPQTGEYYTWDEISQHMGTVVRNESGVDVIYVRWIDNPDQPGEILSGKGVTEGPVYDNAGQLLGWTTPDGWVPNPKYKSPYKKE